MAILLMLVAAVLVALSNLAMRRSIDAGGSARAFLVLQLSLSFVTVFLLNPVRTGNYVWDTTSGGLGLAGGLILGVMMWTLGQALQKGPPGLTFAALNSASVMPAIVMACLFGTAWGHSYTTWNGLGSILVVLGLFWAGWSSTDAVEKRLWVVFAFMAFLLHVLFLSFMQWRALMLTPDEVVATPLLPFHLHESTSQWFMPMIFVAATLIQLIVYLVAEWRLPNRDEVFWGILGGVANGGGTFFLIRSTEVAQMWEAAMIFPIFSVSVIILCNIWGQLLYREHVNWRANSICLGGLIIGTVDWGQLII